MEWFISRTIISLPKVCLRRHAISLTCLIHRMLAKQVPRSTEELKRSLLLACKSIASNTIIMLQANYHPVPPLLNHYHLHVFLVIRAIAIDKSFHFLVSCHPHHLVYTQNRIVLQMLQTWYQHACRIMFYCNPRIFEPSCHILCNWLSVSQTSHLTSARWSPRSLLLSTQSSQYMISQFPHVIRRIQTRLAIFLPTFRAFTGHCTTRTVQSNDKHHHHYTFRK
jgi:hypothetical protein